MRYVFHIAALLLAGGLSIGGARAQLVSSAEIGLAALAGARGNIGVNNSAGIGNEQSNQVVIATAAQRADASLRATQQAERHGSASRSATSSHASIGNGSFAGASGVVAVNQASGHGNAQANMTGLSAANFAEVTIDYLANVHAPGAAGENTGKTGAAVRAGRSAVVADSAFTGASGIVQVNQIAGSGNTTANAFAMSVGASPR